MKRGCLIPVIALLLVLCFVVAAVGAYLIFTTTASVPMVLINSPRSGEHVAIGQEMVVEAIARDEQKIKRIEFWVNGALLDAQTSSVPGGITPFPASINWHPVLSGTHTVTVRAYNAQNRRGLASITLDVTANADRDNDRVFDASDLCPDHAGSVQANGCPDRDGDGLRDADDACPDQAGLLSANGCPVPSADDRDGDGVRDFEDACASQPGSPFARGCPDADGDGVPDATDACPRQPGTVENNGCPIPGDSDRDGVADASDACPGEPGHPGLHGCPDRDGDGVIDRDDLCPDLPGLPGLAGCPDRDGDGVRDAIDLCPTVPGPASNAGCPPTGSGDRDRDGVDDSTDLDPEESGSAENGGARNPGDDTDTNGDGIPDEEEAAGSSDEIIPDGGDWEAINLVQIQALEFTTTRANYTQVYCYVTVPGNAAERYGPFDLIGTQRWDIAEYLGGRNSRTLGVRVGEALSLRVACDGYESAHGGDWDAVAHYDLGSFTRNYDQTQWDGHVITEISGARAEERGDAGHNFQVKFRLCLRSCDTAAFAPPTLRLIRYEHLPISPRLRWTWSGDEHTLTGFRFYINGNRRATIAAADSNRLSLRNYMPDCGETFQYHVTAYRRDGAVTRESPPSNSVTLVGECALPDLTVTNVTQHAGDGQIRIHVRNNGGPLTRANIAINVVRMSRNEQIALLTWDNVSLDAGEVKVFQHTQVIEPVDLRVIIDPANAIIESNERNNVYETPVRMRVEFLGINSLGHCCDTSCSIFDCDSEFVFWVYAGHGTDRHNISWAGDHVRFPSSGEIRVCGRENCTPADAWTMAGNERYTFEFNMPASHNLYVLVHGQEEDILTSPDLLGGVTGEYLPVQNWGARADAYNMTNPDEPGCDDAFCQRCGRGTGARWRITRIR